MTKNYSLTGNNGKTSNTGNKSQQTVVYAPKMPIYLDRYRLKGMNYSQSKIADDMCYGDGKNITSHFLCSKEEMKGLGKLMQTSMLSSEDALWIDMRLMFNSFFTGGTLTPIINKMIDKFKSNNGGEFSHPTLTAAAVKHPSTQKFFSEIEKTISSRLNACHGLIHLIEDENIYNKSRDKSKKSDENKKAFQRPNLHPIFNNFWNDTLWGGLTIAINDTWANEVLITDYIRLSKDSFKVTYLVNVYDHFGLDLPDVDPKVHSLYYALAGFRAWFLLQHLHNFQPFITKFSYEKTFTGSLK